MVNRRPLGRVSQVVVLALVLSAGCTRPKRVRHPEPEPDPPQPVEEPGQVGAHGGQRTQDPK